jgi:hypothetical protein
MFKATDTSGLRGSSSAPTRRGAPVWNLIKHFLGKIAYKAAPHDKVKLPKRKTRKSRTDYPFKIVPEVY